MAMVLAIFLMTVVDTICLEMMKSTRMEPPAETSHMARYGTPERKPWTRGTVMSTTLARVTAGAHLALQVVVEDILHVAGQLRQQDVVAEVLGDSKVLCSLGSLVTCVTCVAVMAHTGPEVTMLLHGMLRGFSASHSEREDWQNIFIARQTNIF